MWIFLRKFNFNLKNKFSIYFIYNFLKRYSLKQICIRCYLKFVLSRFRKCNLCATAHKFSFSIHKGAKQTFACFEASICRCKIIRITNPEAGSLDTSRQNPSEFNNNANLQLLLYLTAPLYPA